MSIPVQSSPKLKSEYDHLYLPHDKVVVMHENDPDLETFEVKLPDPPALHLIDGYGLHPKDQKFVHQQTPDRLKKIEDIVRYKKGIALDEPVYSEDLYAELESNQSNYREEIRWIKLQIKRRFHGYWCFIKGKPTYLNGWNYFFVNFWPVGSESRKDGLPDYRDRDRRWFHAVWYAYTTKEAVFQFRVTHTKGGEKKARYFATKEKALEHKRFLQDKSRLNSHLKSNNIEDIKFEHGVYVVEMDRRTVFGYTYAKHRRDGATFKAQCIQYLIVTAGFKRVSGIQSMNESDARKVFQFKFIQAWKSLPWFFKPEHDGASEPSKYIRYRPKPERGKKKGVVATVKEGLDGFQDYQPAGDLAYDGEKLHASHDDEAGKREDASINIFKRWDKKKNTMAQGMGKVIVGFEQMTSTVEEMEEGGGQQFWQICEGSFWQNRNENGQTSSGLINIFIPAYDGLEGFVDEYGASVIEDPEEPVMGIDGILIDRGAKSHINAVLAQKERDEDWDGLNNEKRKHPQFFMECFISAGNEVGFNMHILTTRKREIMTSEVPLTTRYDLEWVKDFGGPVREVYNNESGRFLVSDIPEQRFLNQQVFDPITGHWGPAMSVYGKKFAGSDPFKFNNTQGSRKSNGAGAVYYPFDDQVDGGKIDPSTWISGKFNVTYNCRVRDKAEYAEDMLKMCVWTGALMYPEQNVPLIGEKFIEWGMRNYLLFDVDERGVIKANPGESTGTSTKEQMFGDWMTYIERYGMYENHAEILQEMIDIKGFKDVTNRDLFVAGWYAMKGSRSKYPKLAEQNLQQETIEGLVDIHTY